MAARKRPSPEDRAEATLGMSGFVGLVPAVRVRLRNLPLRVEYPSDGSVDVAQVLEFGRAARYGLDDERGRLV